MIQLLWGAIVTIHTAAVEKVVLPQDVPAYERYNGAVALARSNRREEAIAEYREVLRMKPDLAEAHNNLGTLISRDGRGSEEAVYHYNAAFSAAVDDANLRASALNNLGHLMAEAGGKDYAAHRQAVDVYSRALALDPQHIDATYNLGNAFYAQRRTAEALATYERVIQLDPYHPGCRMNLGNIALDRGNLHVCVRHQQAILDAHEKHGRAVPLRDRVAALNNMGQALKLAGDAAGALRAHHAAQKLNPNDPATAVNAYTARRALCQWRQLETVLDNLMRITRSQIRALAENLSSGRLVDTSRAAVIALLPYDSLLLPADAGSTTPTSSPDGQSPEHWQLVVARAMQLPWDRITRIDLHKLSASADLAAPAVTKLHVGYLSYDFRDHPMGHLTLGVLQQHHSRIRVGYGSLLQVGCFSYGRDDNSTYRQQIEAACGTFDDINDVSDAHAAALIAQRAPLILVDLMAHTRGTRLGITALKPAPIIVNYLGYPGTMGSSYTDYIIGDRVVTPPDWPTAVALRFSEKIVLLPEHYQANHYSMHLDVEMCDGRNIHCPKRAAEDAAQTGAPVPPGSIVLCNFNTIDKMEPESFGLWMAVMRRTPRAVLWLLRPKLPLGKHTMHALRAEAAARGILPNRLIFADRMPKHEHLHRLRAVQLFLDSTIYGAHSTASDALWAAVPIITMQGEAFPSRVAASLSRALGESALSERPQRSVVPLLVVHSLKEYECGASNLTAGSTTAASTRLAKLRRRVARAILPSALFDTARMATELERAYRAMAEVRSRCAHDWSVRSCTGVKGGRGGAMHLVIAPAQRHLAERKRASAEALRKALEHGIKWHQSGRLEAAIAAHGRVAAVVDTGEGSDNVAGNAADAWHLLGLALHQNKQRKHDAVRFVQRAVRMRPNTSFYRSNLGEVLRSIGADAEAEKQFRVALEIDGDPQAYSNLLKLLLHHQRHTQIVELIDAGGEVLARSKPSTLSAAQIADMHFTHAVALANDNSSATSAKRSVHHFEMAANAGRGTELESTALFNLGSVLERLGEGRRAWSVMQHAVQLQHATRHAAFWHQQERDGRRLPLVSRPAGRTTIAIYCEEYGQSWWPGWGPASVGRGLGGSEEAVVFLSRELVLRGFWVEIYGQPPAADVGLDAHGVVWYPAAAYDAKLAPADVFVAWRYHISLALARHSRVRYLWLQDTVSVSSFTPKFSASLSGVFCLSRFAASLLPGHMHSRAVVSPNALDPAYFVSGNDWDHERNVRFIYGSAPNRGLETVLKLWPSIRAALPKAILEVYYGFSKGFMKWGPEHIPHFDQWVLEMKRLLKQPGVAYVGMANHTALARAYARAGFALYPTTYPETGCVSLMKAQAMGAIPITSRYATSTLPELCGEYDMGPRPLNGSLSNDPGWAAEWVDAVVTAASSDFAIIQARRRSMVRWARSTFLWSRVAHIWHEAIDRSTAGMASLPDMPT